MGGLLSSLWGRLFSSKKNFKILILGLANAGKTTILYHFNLGKTITTQPTIGSNVEEVTHKNVTFQMWDLGGQEKLRSVWPTFFTDTDAVIYVIDSTDRKNDVTCRGELFKLIIHEVRQPSTKKLKHAVFLVFANKQDSKEAMTEEEIMLSYSLGEIKNHKWHLQLCSATEGKGLTEGLDWLTNQITTAK